MPMLGGKTSGFKVPALQADAVLSQASPVSGTKYTVLATTTNVRIWGFAAAVTWTVQPNPLEGYFTIDGNAYTFTQANPVSATHAQAKFLFSVTETSEPFQPPAYHVGGYLIEGRSVLVQVETTGGTVQNLDGRLKYSRW